MDQHSPDMLPSVEIPSAAQGSGITEYAHPQAQNSERGLARSAEQAPAAGPVGGALPRFQANPNPGAAPQPTAGGQQATGTISLNPQVADDTDLIEKEWVDKAKQIVEHTKHDPYLQNKEMGTMKADYLKKRYNKDVKLSSD